MIPSAPLVRFAVRLLGVVPAAPVRWVARRAGSLAYLFARDRREILLENQAALAPNESPAGRRARVRRTFQHLIEAAVELWRVPTMSRADFESLVAMEGTRTSRRGAGDGARGHRGHARTSAPTSWGARGSRSKATRCTPWSRSSMIRR